MSGADTKAAIEVDAKPGETKDGKRVLAVTIDENGTRYKLDDTHTLVLVGETKTEIEFECSYCRSRIAFALPGLGEPAAVGKPGAWGPHPDFMTWMDKCSTS